jgi:hypothetical protein
VDQLPSVAQGGNGVVTPGCPACRKRLFKMANFVDHLEFVNHLEEDVLTDLINKLSAEKT